jgi:dUTP pyrophosphatase
MKTISIQFTKSHNNITTPKYMTSGAAGADLFTSLNEDILIKPLERAMIPTGIKVIIPEGYEIQIRPRSGMAFKKGLTVINSPGTIDSDYRGEINVLVVNLSNKDIVITNNERIAQMVLNKVEVINFVEIDNITSNTHRGSGGFGHTGSN